ncbi:MAG: DUF421 domain-containing protein [Clostridiaceae bacterium]|jgi:uncharacterized membrane protein YcaP (DUF421 family)|nr:DUF421 domain-containing protein [Clostridiaceae bacterium]
MLVVFARALVLYILVVIVMRIMGKRQIGQLQPFELVIAIMISELAAVPMQNTGIPLVNGIIPILTLLAVQLLISILSVRSIWFRAMICGKPTVLIENGKISESALRNELITLHDLLEQLRINNCPNISDVEFAILETNGQLSVIPKPQKRPVTPNDMNVQAQPEGMTIDLIIDGRIMDENLRIAGKDRQWLLSQLQMNRFSGPADVFYACIDTASQQVFFQAREKGVEKPR